ncbi:hypothetical protein [Lysobacter terrae]
MRVLPIFLALATLPALAAGTTPAHKPEIVRGAATPQAIGAVHTVRGLPEACARFEGVFTGDVAQPYRFTAVRTSPQCQPRARLVDFAKAQPSEAKGWKFNDEIRIPNAACPSQVAVVHVWRKPGDVAPPERDAQGRSRIYLQDAKRQRGAALPLYTAQMAIEGKACGK